MASTIRGRSIFEFDFDLWMHLLSWLVFGGALGTYLLLGGKLLPEADLTLKLALFVTAVNIAGYQLFYRPLVARWPRSAIVWPLLTAASIFLLYRFFGGLASPLFAVFFVMFLFIALSNYVVGIVIALVGLTDVTLTVAGPGAPLRAVIPAAAAYLAFLPVSWLYGRRIFRLADESRRAAYLAERLTQEKSKEENLLSSMADAVYAVDPERRIVQFNKQAEELTELPASDVLELHCFDVLKFHDEKGVNFCKEGNCPAVESMRAGTAVNREFYYTGPSKNTLSISYSTAPIRDFSGKITGAISIFKDVTKKKEVERMRNEFVSIASHEMRTPLFAIEGYLSLAQRMGKVHADPKIGEYVSKARASVISMSALLKNLLAFSKIEEGKVEIKHENFDLKDAISESIETLMPKAEAKGLALEFVGSLSAERGKKAIIGNYTVRADREKIKEVLLNLIDNGIKFTKTGTVAVLISGDLEFVKVCVKDTGPGIAKTDQARLFQKFYRVDNTFTREVGGTGLGLYLSREMIELFGGKIWVDSDEGQGSTFCFTLPRVKR